VIGANIGIALLALKTDEETPAMRWGDLTQVEWPVRDDHATSQAREIPSDEEHGDMRRTSL
jgi:hypothetical protein